MKNISLNLSISLTEYGISGFTLKDTTSISTSSIYPEVSQISANYLRTKDSYDSLKFGASCSSATAYSKGLATREKIDAIYQNTVVQKID